MTLPSDKVAISSAEPSDGSRFQEIKKVDLPSDSVLRDRPSSDAATSAAEPSDSTHCQEMDPPGASGDVASSAAEPSDSTHCREMDLPGDSELHASGDAASSAAGPRNGTSFQEMGLPGDSELCGASATESNFRSDALRDFLAIPEDQLPDDIERWPATLDQGERELFDPSEMGERPWHECASRATELMYNAMAQLLRGTPDERHMFHMIAAQLLSSIHAQMREEPGGFFSDSAWSLVSSGVRGILHGLRDVVLEEDALDDDWAEFVDKVMGTLRHARDLRNSDSVRRRLLRKRLRQATWCGGGGAVD